MLDGIIHEQNVIFVPCYSGCQNSLYRIQHNKENKEIKWSESTYTRIKNIGNEIC